MKNVIIFISFIYIFSCKKNSVEEPICEVSELGIILSDQFEYTNQYAKTTYYYVDSIHKTNTNIKVWFSDKLKQENYLANLTLKNQEKWISGKYYFVDSADLNQSDLINQRVGYPNDISNPKFIDFTITHYQNQRFIYFYDVDNICLKLEGDKIGLTYGGDKVADVISGNPTMYFYFSIANRKFELKN